jgi:Holliday junction DNA helicase RuvA
VYEFLEGVVAARTPARLVLDVGGVGYDLAVPIGARFPESGRARIWTHMIVRDDAHLLYGFPDRETRAVFRLLLSVRGVGPGVALGVLSGLGREELVAAVLAEDPSPLTRVRGVGRKTAQQILLDLKDKVGVLGPASGGAARLAPGERNLEDAAQALVSIGYSEREAQQLVQGASKRTDPADLEALVRCALSGS